MIIESFGKFLNSINCSVQILCENNIIDPNKWLLKNHDEEYYDFLKKTIEEKKVTIALFYVVFSASNEYELNLTKTNIIKQIKRCGLISEEVELFDPQFKPKLSKNHVKVGEWYYSTLIVDDWPHSGEAGWMEDLYNLDKNISLSMFIHPAEKENATYFINRRLAQLKSSDMVKAEDDADDGSEDAEINTAINMRDELYRNDGKFFFVNYYITVKAKSLDELQFESKNIRNFLNGLMISTRKADFRQDDGFRCSLPHGVDYLKSKSLYTFTTTPLKSFFPFISSNIVDDGGILIGENLSNNSLVFLNHFNYFTASMLVIGKSGSGKSYGVKSQISKLVKQGIEVTVLDIDREFKNMQLDDNLIVKSFNEMSEFKEFLIKYWEEVRNNPHIPRFLVIDEFWEYMKDEECSYIIQQIIKKGRKHWLGLCAITQEVEDLLESEFARSIINNSSIKMLLKMEFSQKEQLQKTFGITESESSFLINADEGEGILFAGTNHVQFKTIVSESQHKMITTKPQEIWSDFIIKNERKVNV